MSVLKNAVLFAVILFLPMAVAGNAASAAPVDDEASFVWDINQLRSAHGAPALVVDPQLTTVARNFAAVMAASGGIYHNPNLAAQAPDQWIKLGENVGVGVDEPGLHQAFVNSPGHYRNLVDADFRYVGIGVVYSNGRMWVVEAFMQTATPPPATASSPPPASIKSAKAQQFVSTMQSKAPMGLRERIAVGGR